MNSITLIKNGFPKYFPDELYILIFNKLDQKTLGKIKLVCKLWYDIAQDNDIWKLISTKAFPEYTKTPQISWKDFYRANLSASKNKHIYTQNRMVMTTMKNKIVSFIMDNPFYPRGSHKSHVQTSHQGSITCFQVKEREEVLITGSSDKTVKFWKKNKNDWDCIKTLKGHQGPIMCLKSNERYLVTGSTDRTIKLWENYRHIQTLR